MLYTGSARSSWSCYFLPETSEECRKVGLELEAEETAWAWGKVATKDTLGLTHWTEEWLTPAPKYNHRAFLSLSFSLRMTQL